MRLAYVVPRYGPQILGGAETLARTTAEHLVQHGHYVEVWTTCAQNPYTHVNEYPAGIEQHNGITVRRFPAQIHRQFNPWVEPLTRENQYLWVDSLLHSPQLYDYIADHNDAFDFLVFIPYVAGTTYYGARICPQKSIVWTCVHDEWPAYLAPTRELLSDVAGIILNSQAEKEFLEKTLRIRHPDRMVAGTGVDVVGGDASTFRQAYPHVPEQFFVYAGRLDEGKNVHELLRYYSEYQSRHDPHPGLVLLGEGPLGEEEHPGVYVWVSWTKAPNATHWQHAPSSASLHLLRASPSSCWKPGCRADRCWYTKTVLSPSVTSGSHRGGSTSPTTAISKGP